MPSMRSVGVASTPASLAALSVASSASSYWFSWIAVRIDAVSERPAAWANSISLGGVGDWESGGGGGRKKEWGKAKYEAGSGFQKGKKDCRDAGECGRKNGERGKDVRGRN